MCLATAVISHIVTDCGTEVAGCLRHAGMRGKQAGPSTPRVAAVLAWSACALALLVMQARSTALMGESMPSVEHVLLHALYTWVA